MSLAPLLFGTVSPNGWSEVDSTRIDWPSDKNLMKSFSQNPYEYQQSDNKKCSGHQSKAASEQSENIPIKIIPMPLMGKAGLDLTKTVIRLPSYEKIKGDSALYAHASRILHLESNPHNARVLVQRHGSKEIWVNYSAHSSANR